MAIVMDAMLQIARAIEIYSEIRNPRWSVSNYPNPTLILRNCSWGIRLDLGGGRSPGAAQVTLNTWHNNIFMDESTMGLRLSVYGIPYARALAMTTENIELLCQVGSNNYRSNP